MRLMLDIPRTVSSQGVSYPLPATTLFENFKVIYASPE